MEFQRRSRRGKVAESEQEKDKDGEKGIKDADPRHGQVPIHNSSAELESPQVPETHNYISSAEQKEDTSSTISALHNLEAAKTAIDAGDDISALQIPLRLVAIRIEGAKTMRSSFLARLCKPYIDPTVQNTPLNRFVYGQRLNHVMPGQSTTLPAVLQLLSSVASDVASLDQFADLAASLEPSTTSTLSSPHQKPSVEDVDIVLQCKEKPRYFVKTSTDVGNGEGNATIQARIRNLLGGAEVADISALMGTRTRRAFQASLSWPVFGFRDHLASVTAFAQDRDLSSYASAIEGIRGVRCALQLQTGLQGTHEFAYDLSHRHLGRLQPTASLSMRALAGHSIKSSLSHTWTRDSRDDPFLSTRGGLLKVQHEYAGLGGDAYHYKCESEAQISRILGHHGFGISFAARTGFLASLNGRAPAFSDRFQLGGPTCVRMFRYNSLGPKDGLDSLGGEAYYSTGASLFLPPWPHKAHWPFKLHTFINAGQLIQLHPQRGSWTPAKQTTLLVDELLRKPSCSVGVGIMFQQGNLRAELNVGAPLAMRRGDGARKGVQLGVGLSFL